MYASAKQELYDYLVAHNIQPVGYMPIGSPRRPERDICPEDVADLEVPEMQAIAKSTWCSSGSDRSEMGTSEVRSPFRSLSITMQKQSEMCHRGSSYR